jgi:hypothetical protein
MSLGCSKLV